MAVDLTEVKYKCPLCGELKDSTRDVRKHINKSKDDTHKGRQGAVIMKRRTVEEVKGPDFGSTEDFNKKVKKAVEDGYVDELNNETIKKIADKAGIHHSRVIRAIKDLGIDESWVGRKTWKIEQLTDEQRKVLEEYADADIPRYPDWTVNHKDDGTPVYQDEVVDWVWDWEDELSPEQVRKAIRKYYWMVDEYRDHKDEENVVGENSDYSGKVETEGSLQDMVNSVKEETQEKEEKSDTTMEIELESKEEQFDVLKMFIENGKTDKAKKLFYDAIEE